MYLADIRRLHEDEPWALSKLFWHFVVFVIYGLLVPIVHGSSR